LYIGINHCKNQYRKLSVDFKRNLIYNWYDFNVSLKLTLKYNCYNRLWRWRSFFAAYAVFRYCWILLKDGM